MSLSSLLLLLSLLSFLLPFLAQSGPSPLNDDVLGLIVFKADVSDPFSHLSSWNEDSDHPCNWLGVGCDPKSNRVTHLTLSNLSLSGKLSRGLLLLQYLKTLDLSRNNLTGSVPPDLLRLKNLENLDLSENGLSGSLPSSFFEQCRLVRSVSLASNGLTGSIPGNVGNCLSLASLNLSHNQFSEALPGSIWNLVGLRSLDLSYNALFGDIPPGMNTSVNLRMLNLRNNQLTGQLPGEIGALVLLKSLDVSNNLLNGTLPDSIGSLAACQYLGLSSNLFIGVVPIWIGGMRSLESLDLSWNKLSGEIPSSINNLHYLREVRLSRNSFTGGVPAWVFESGVERVSISDNMLSGSIQLAGKSSSGLHFLDLSGNSLSGWVPPDISYLKNLQFLNFSHNSLSGDIPATIGDLKLLETLDLSSNNLNHTIPSDICELASLKVLNLEKNSFYGEIPTQIGKCISLTSLDLSENNFSGRIPLSISSLRNLQRLDLSRNKITGELPKQFSSLPQLTYFNVSHNKLTGQVPSGTFFDSLPQSSLSDNEGLCGAVLNISCPAVMPKPIVLNPNSSSSNNPLTQPNVNPTTALHHKKIILSISTLVAIGGAAIIAVGILTITVLNFRVRSNESQPATALDLSDGYLSQSPRSDANSGKLVRIGGGDLEFSAAGHALLNKDCELGRGGFGTVYKTVLRDGQPVAIKKLTVSSLVKSKDDFEREVRLFGKVKHRNLVGLKGYYWTSSLQLLIYDYIPGGNLYKHLHESSASDSLSWLERFDIILGVAKGLAHLHRHGIVHYNIKSTNVLLDGSGEPKLADYGLAKLLPMLDRYVLCSKIQSALGYMAPEFACKTVKITEKCDIFGYGVLVLEMLTGRHPVEYLEDDVVVLCDIVRVCLEEGRVEELIDQRLGGDFPLEEAMPIVKLGLVCTSQVPSNRPDMSEVVKILEVIRSPQGSPVEELLV
ncbi:hypothetical protein LUZ63_018027 [Rhynchospora breviuscula]|uniref:Protein kinase domain-containing protein n=1 Tax=Rhynchospora breviuscula TaxID=2022672 RepID=A0A9Q0HGV9_9POAL|nr:hypothetical protein LUZ63_018027 [Rhynchospora breviuscula]